MQRKDEILAKKAKLAELRRQREEREQRQKEHGRRESTFKGDESSDLKVPTPRRSTDRRDLDDLIENLVGDRPGSRGTGTASPAGRKTRPSSTLSGVQVGAETYGQSDTTSTGPYKTASTQTAVQEDETPRSNDQRADVVKPAKPQTYEKFTQTSEEWTGSPTDESDGSISDREKSTSPSGSRRAIQRKSKRQRETEAELRENLRREIEEELQAAKNLTLNGTAPSTVSNFPVRGLSNDELNALAASEDFMDFVDRSSKVIEKALDQDYDIMADYALDGVDIGSDEDEGYANGRGRKGRRVRQVAQFYEERFCGKRMISDLCFSPKVKMDPLFRRTPLTSKSILSCYWLPIPRTRLRHRIRAVSSISGTCISILVLSTPSTAPPTSSLQSSLPTTPLSLSAALTRAKSCSGIPALALLSQLPKPPLLERLPAAIPILSIPSHWLAPRTQTT